MALTHMRPTARSTTGAVRTDTDDDGAGFYRRRFDIKCLPWYCIAKRKNTAAEAVR